MLPAISLSPDFEGETMSNYYGRPLYAHRVPQGGDACDFCNTSPAFKGYQCENFEFSGLPLFRSGSGMWAACRKCSELVDAEKWSSLADRAVRNSSNATPYPVKKSLSFGCSSPKSSGSLRSTGSDWHDRNLGIFSAWMSASHLRF